MYKASDVMDMAAAVLNDSGKALFTYAVQLPYVRIANRELEQDLILHEVQVSLVDEEVIPVAAGDKELALPPSFFVPISIYERKSGGNDSNWYPTVEKRVIEPTYPAKTTLDEWTFKHNCIVFNAPSASLEVRLEYWRTLPAIQSSNDTQFVIGAINTLGFKTGELCAKYIGNNTERATMCSLDYREALDKLLSIYVKNNQGVRVRRKAFRRITNRFFGR